MKMNSIEAYADAGTAAGTARNHNDEPTARFHTRWARSAIRLEDSEYKQEARRAFDEAYKLARQKRNQT